MAKFQIKSGRTSQMVNIFVQNNSVTTGAGLTGLSNNSSNLIGHFIRENDSASTPITIVSAAIGTFTTGGIIEIESSAMPGLYQVGLPNAICSAGTSRWATVYYFGATNMAPSILEIELTQTDNQDVVRGGMTALPNAAAAAANGLLTAGTGANQISTSAGAMLIQAGAATGQLDFTAGVVKANLTQTLGTTSTGQAGSVGIDWAQIVNKTAVVDLTQTIISSVSGNVGGSVASVVGAVGSVLAGGLIDLTTTTYGEPSSPVAATATLKDMLVWLKTLARNKITQTATTETLFKDDGSTPISTSTDSDDGTTFTRGRWS